MRLQHERNSPALWQLMSVIERQTLVRKGKLFHVFCDVQKEFLHTWRARLVAKLRENGIVSDLLTNIMRSGALNCAVCSCQRRKWQPPDRR
jgi:hypothetical protein